MNGHGLENQSIQNSHENCKMKTRHLRIQDAGFDIGKKEEVISNNYKLL